MNVAKLIADQMFNDSTKQKVVDGLNKNINIPSWFYQSKIVRRFHFDKG